MLLNCVSPGAADTVNSAEEWPPNSRMERGTEYNEGVCVHMYI